MKQNKSDRELKLRNSTNTRDQATITRFNDDDGN
jgi:hypothetical protein